MTKDKGVIDVTNVKSEQAFNWIKEILKKSKDDSINIKNEEFNAVIEITIKLEKEFNVLKGFHTLIKPVLTAKQKDDYLDYLENK